MMSKPNDPGQPGSTFNSRMMDAAKLTSIRLQANDALQAWYYLQRGIEKIRAIYGSHPNEKALLEWLKKGQEGAQERIMKLEDEIAAYDEHLANLTAKLRDEYLGDDQL